MWAQQITEQRRLHGCVSVTKACAALGVLLQRMVLLAYNDMSFSGEHRLKMPSTIDSGSLISPTLTQFFSSNPAPLPASSSSKIMPGQSMSLIFDSNDISWYGQFIVLRHPSQDKIQTAKARTYLCCCCVAWSGWHTYGLLECEGVDNAVVGQRCMHSRVLDTTNYCLGATHACNYTYTGTDTTQHINFASYLLFPTLG